MCGNYVTSTTKGSHVYLNHALADVHVGHGLEDGLVQLLKAVEVAVDNVLDLVRVLAKRHPEVAWEGGKLHKTTRLGATCICHPEAAWARVGGGGWVVKHIQ
jgi:hypothetical protein